MVEVLPLVRVTVTSQADPSALGASTSTLKCTVRSLDDQPPATAFLPVGHDVVKALVDVPLLIAWGVPVTIS